MKLIMGHITEIIGRPLKRRAAAKDIRQHIVGVDGRVPVLDGRLLPYVNFDNAASTPVLHEVLDTINNFMPWYSSVHRGSGYKSIVSTEAYEEARQTVAEFFGANSQDHVVLFGKNSTEALNKLSYRLELSKEDVVLVSLLEHHSNDLPWRKQATVKRIKTDQAGELDEHHFQELLEQYKGKIQLVAVTGGSNVTGFMPDIAKLAKLAHEAGAQILVDCAQLAPHRAIDIKKLDNPEHLDYIVISAHKMYAPFGTGALIGRRDTFEKGIPEICGGGTIDLVTTSRVAWAALPDRDEAGSPNVVGAVALAASLRILSKLGMDHIATHEAELTGYLLNKLSNLPKVQVYGDTDPGNTGKRLGVVPFQVEGLKHSLVSAILGTEYAIGVRSGCFCAHPYVTDLLHLKSAEIKNFGSQVLSGNKSEMPGLVRASFGLYNTSDEIDKLVGALEDISAGRYKGKYRQNKRTGDFAAEGWQPDIKLFEAVGS